VTVSNTPPCTLTPCASPNVCTGNFHAHADVHRHAQQIHVQQISLTGSTCQSFTMAAALCRRAPLETVCCGPSWNAESVRVASRSRRAKALRPLPPYKIAGTLPVTRSRRASFFPRRFARCCFPLQSFLPLPSSLLTSSQFSVLSSKPKACAEGSAAV